jgi:arylsulfatase A-like enzyme
MLSGKYNHNLNCQELGWCGDYVESGNENKSFAVALQAAGYNTGYFGKYLNNGTSVSSSF